MSSSESGSESIHEWSYLTRYPVGDQSSDAASDQAKDPANAHASDLAHDKARENLTSFV